MDSNSPCKDLLFRRGPYLTRKPLYLVNVLKRESMILKEIGGLGLPISSSEHSKNRKGTVASAGRERIYETQSRSQHEN